MKVLKFYADWCVPCKMLTGVIKSLDVSLPVEEVNVEEQADMAIKYNVRSLPTCVLVSDDGQEIRRRVGSMTGDEFLKFTAD